MRKEEKTEITKEKIITAATEEFGKNGYFGASMNNICASGISKGLMYHNFSNKDELYLACVGRCFCLFTDYMKKCSIGTSLHEYARVRLLFFNGHENEARLFFETLLQPPEALKERICELRAELDDFNRELYIKIIDAVKLRPGVTKDDAVLYMKLIQEMFNGYFSSPAVSGMSIDETVREHEKKLPEILDYFLYGIAERSKQE